MILAVAILLGFVLTVLAALHFYWAYGGHWPASSEQGLAQWVVGDPRATRMPSRYLAVAVAVALESATLVAWLLAFRVAPTIDLLVTSAGLVLTLVFLGRGAAGYVPAWRAWRSAEPFATWDRLLYSPLCLALGGGFLFLVWSRVTA